MALPFIAFIARAAMSRLMFMEEQQRSSPTLRSLNMNATKFFAAAAVFLAAGSAFAADTPVAAAAVATAATAANSSIAVIALNVPTVTISNTRARAEVKAEAAEAVRTYKSTLAKQLELANN
jgi:hypothetical protein